MMWYDEELFANGDVMYRFHLFLFVILFTLCVFYDEISTLFWLLQSFDESLFVNCDVMYCFHMSLFVIFCTWCVFYDEIGT